ncbi:uncharacterized protein LOC129738173 [Uranotaenia lowii]|uniref:uncharacterized protein LOC129738173 n=1 Tax=Uranotaenia lowii TaxID=190385 RepID=UPI00247973C3|nr:uncharacterized protein LOC129738173 [Uranotaenia lowii]
MTPNIRELYRKERVYLDTIDNLKAFVSTYNPENDKTKLEGWKQRVEIIFEQFQRNRLEIEISLDNVEKPDTIGAEDFEEEGRRIRSTFENDYMFVLGFLTSELASLSPSKFPSNKPQPLLQQAQSEISNKTSSQSSPTRNIDPEEPSTSATILASTTIVDQPRNVPATILLQTAIVQVVNSFGNIQWVRALLDPASQLNLASENIVQKLRLPRHTNHQAIGGVGNSTIVSNHAVHLQISSHCTQFSTKIHCQVLKKITRELPERSLAYNNWVIPPNVVLADPSFHQPGPIDLLLGMEIYYDLLLEGFTKLGPEQPILQNTVLGWVAAGKIGSVFPESTSRLVHVCSCDSLDTELSRLWELEKCWTNSSLSVEESSCEKHFAETTFRDESGRFVVTLPKHQSELARLGNSKDIAAQRFFALERRFIMKPELKASYSAFINEYHQLGHMQEIFDEINHPSPSYYLPHHGVEKVESTTTKLRVVFDASCSSDTGVSLNKALKVGPVVQDDLFTIILRFRTHQFVIISDIEKMYRQIRIHPSDYPLQRILWRNSPDEPLRTFELQTVTYGTASAPYLATKCLQELSKQGAKEYPLAAKAFGRDFYVDDALTGCDDEAEGKKLCSQLIALAASAGFSLRKFASNSKLILSEVPPELRDERTLFDLDASSSPIKTLGLQWEPSKDTFRFSTPPWNYNSTVTRRTVLSDIARIYDPLGLIGPVFVVAKIFIQSLWKDTISWDDLLEEKQQHFWIDYRQKLSYISEIVTPRWLEIPNIVHHEVHGFCDASEKAYGACLYLRAISSDGTISAQLIAAKSKVAPLGNSKRQRRICLPRLELSAALTLSHLYNKIKESNSFDHKAIFWTDSMIVLHWLNSVPSRWKTFIANRVSEVQHLTAEGIWAHVPGIENPADIISRGMYPEQLKEASLWWHGPTWLRQSSRFWPPLQYQLPDDFPVELLEEQKVALPIQIHAPNEVFLLRSSFPALTRLVALLLRASHNCKRRNRSNRITGFIRITELNRAMETLVKLAQQETFEKDISVIKAEGQVKPNSKLKNLAPFVEDGLLRVGGRLRHAPISKNRKHPMILPSRHPLTESIMTYYHLKNLHAGAQLLVACVREKFWPLRIRNLARKVVHSCIRCFRCKPTNLDQIMGDLPTERVTPTFAFTNSGVDLCGPFQYRASRRTTPVTCYVALFVCLVTKACHLELVHDLSTSSFIAALHRFIGRRGKPNIIECDNAKNFRGASRQLATLAQQFSSQQFQSNVINSCATDGITFKFIPPRSPHFGGLWEAAVKSFKQHLKATVGKYILSQEEFNTLLVRIEACLNSRPLTPTSADPNDLEILTPGHFLIHRPMNSFPEPDLSHIPRNRLDRWQENQELLRRFWKRWTTEYLSGLHQRTKWTQRRDNIAIGTLVLLKDENLPPLKWRFGRITRIVRGNDNNVRVVTVKTCDGEYDRTIAKICVLPINQPTIADGSDANTEEFFIPRHVSRLSGRRLHPTTKSPPNAVDGRRTTDEGWVNEGRMMDERITNWRRRPTNHVTIRRRSLGVGGDQLTTTNVNINDGGR